MTYLIFYLINPKFTDELMKTDTIGYVLSYSFPEEMKLLEQLNTTSNPTLLHFYRGCHDIEPEERYELRLMRAQGTYSIGKYLQNLSGSSKNVLMSAVRYDGLGNLECLFGDIGPLCVERAEDKLNDKETKEKEKVIDEEGPITGSPCIDLSRPTYINSSSSSNSSNRGGSDSIQKVSIEGNRKRKIESVSTSSSAGQHSVGSMDTPLVPLSTALAEHLVPTLLTVWSPLKKLMLLFQSKILLSNDIMPTSTSRSSTHFILFNCLCSLHSALYPS